MKLARTSLLGLLLAAATGLAAQSEGGTWQHHNFSFAFGVSSGSYLDYEYTSWWSQYRVRGSSGVSFDIRYGYQFLRNWEWTVGSTGIVNKAKSSYYNGMTWVETGSDDIKTSALLTGMKGHWYPGGRGINLYGGGEIGYGMTDGGRYNKNGGFAWAITGGAEFPLGDRFRLRTEGRHIAVNATPNAYYYYGSPTVTASAPSYNTFALAFVFGWGD